MRATAMSVFNKSGLIAACTLWRPLASWMADSSVVVRGVSSPLAAVM